MRQKFFFGKKWFFEDAPLLGEPATTVWGVLSEREVYTGKSNYQRIEIFDTREYGRVMALDGLVQLSTKYEFVYHEMLVHPALFYARNPRKALIIGGGDGGALRELVKHPLHEILMVDIDREVIEVSKKYLPSLSDGAFGDRRVTVLHEDAFRLMSMRKNAYDIIISDCTDCYGPSKALWSRRFYRSVLEALSRDGVASFQTGYFKERYAKRGRRDIQQIFPFSKIHRAFVGCFPLDECAFTFASKSIDFSKLRRSTVQRKCRRRPIHTKYYSPEMHFASAVIPEYCDRRE